MPNDVTIATTTDSNDAAQKATGDFKVESYEVADTTTDSSKTAQAEETAKKAAASEALENEEIVENESEEEIEARETEEPGKVGKKKGGYQRRLDKLTKQRADAQRETEYWKAEAMKNGKAAGDPKPAEAKVVATAETAKDEPKAEQFDKHEDYVKALAKWEVRQELAAEKTQQRIDAMKGEQQKQLKSHVDRVVEFEKATPDFKELMQDIADVKLSVTVNNAIIESDFGPQLMYEFAKNPAELDRLNALSPAAAERAIGRMEAKFEASSSGKKVEAAVETTPTKKVSTAPKPISPLNSKVGHTKTISDELPYDEWVKIRRSDLKNG